MTRSHPPSLTSLIRRALRDECGVVAGDSILVAVSGGADSTALLHSLWLVADRLGLRIVACGVDHGLRPEARLELDIVARLCARIGFHFERVQLRLEDGSNLQARARDARYRALREVQGQLGLKLLATAHQGEDRAETVLLRLLRGAPPEGLGVLPWRSEALIRPMLAAARSDVLAHLERHGLEYAEDPSNQNARFLRVRVRRELLPLLAELSPGIVGHLNALADELTAGALPAVRDADGSALRLGQAQRKQLRKALRDQSTHARVLLKGARALRLNGNFPQLLAVPVDRDEKS